MKQECCRGMLQREDGLLRVGVVNTLRFPTDVREVENLFSMRVS